MSYEGRFDVVIEGLGTERGATVIAASEGLYVNQRQVPHDTLLGVALRGSILLVIGTQAAMAFHGDHQDLAALAAELRGRADLGHLALSDREALEGERVVFATPVAVSGLIENERIKGLALAAVTNAALHVFERGGRHSRLAWDLVSRWGVSQARFGRVLRMASGATRLELLYLTDAQLQTAQKLAAQAEGSAVGALAPAEFVAEPELEAGDFGDLRRCFTVPEFEASLSAMSGGPDRQLSAAVKRLESSTPLPSGFLEEHLQELHSIYVGGLLEAKRETAGAEDLFAVAAALDGRRLSERLSEAVGVIGDATVRSLERLMRRVAANRRLPWRVARRKYMPAAREVTGLKNRLNRSLSELEQELSGVSESAGQLQRAAEADTSGLEAAYLRWQRDFQALDRSYAAAWTGLGRELVGVWEDTFVPKLARLGAERRRLLPGPLRVALFFVVLIATLAGLFLVFGDRLGELVGLG